MDELPPLTRRSFVRAGSVLLGLLGAGLRGSPRTGHAQAKIEGELVLQTPVSRFIVEAALRAFAAYAAERWMTVVRTRAEYAGTPVSFQRIVAWRGRPAADLFWGGESALFDALAERQLVVPHRVSGELIATIPTSIGRPRPIPLKDPRGHWVGTALEPYGLVYHPSLLRRLGAPAPQDWEDLLHPALRGQVAQCAPTRSSSSHATYEVILQAKGEAAGWAWLTRLAAHSGVFTERSHQVASLVAQGKFAAGFAVPSYMAFEEVLAGFEVRFVAPPNAFVTPEPIAVLAGAPHPRAARAFIEFLLTEQGQRVFMERGLFPITPRYRVAGPPGSVAERAVAFTGGVRSYFDGPVANVYDEALAQARYQQVNERYRREIEVVWETLKRPG